MKSHELDALVAKTFPELARYDEERTLVWRNWSGLGKRLFQPSSDIAAVWEVEEKIMNSGLQAEYAKALWVLVTGWEEIPDNVDLLNVLEIAHASPVDRCLAALKAVGVEV